MNKAKLKLWIPEAVLSLRLWAKERIRFIKDRAAWSDQSFFAELKDKKAGKRAFLIATGPSLKLENLATLKGEYCVSASNFFLHPACGVIAPEFHCIAPYHEPWTEADFVLWLKDAHQKLPRQTKLLTSFDMKPAIERSGVLEGREVHYLYLTSSRTFTGADCAAPIERPASVPLMILPFLIHQGFSEIYLLGCDHTVLRDFGGATISHFYEASQDARMAFLKDKLWDDVRSELENTALVFDRYAKYQAIAEQKGLRLINLSQDSWLGFFERRKLAEIL